MNVELIIKYFKTVIEDKRKLCECPTWFYLQENVKFCAYVPEDNKNLF